MTGVYFAAAVSDAAYSQHSRYVDEVVLILVPKRPPYLNTINISLLLDNTIIIKKRLNHMLITKPLVL